MESSNLARDIASLPPEAQRQVADFVAFLKLRYRRRSPVKVSSVTELADEPFIGMWHDREDMNDSSAWVSQLRDRDWEADR